MENTTTAKQQIKNAFIQYIRQHGKAPATPYNLMAELGEDEKFFYDNYSSFNNIEQEIWGEYLTETVQRLRSESVYAEYMVREKLLAFYFTLVEVLKENRSFVTNELSARNGGFRRKILADFKDGFYEYINVLLEEGMDTGEVEQRIFIAKKYDIEAIGYAALNPPEKYALKTHIREYFAKTKAVIDLYIIHKEPKFLGKKVKINI